MGLFRKWGACAVAAAILAGASGSAQAGWITVTNDTQQVIVIHEKTGPANAARGKCVKLQPGETYREYSLRGGSRTVTLYDAEAPTTPLTTGTMTWEKTDTAFTVKADGKKVSVGPVERKK
jgi:hypothetical protein